MTVWTMWKSRLGPEKGPKNTTRFVSERISEQETGVLPMSLVDDKNIGDQAV